MNKYRVTITYYIAAESEDIATDRAQSGEMWDQVDVDDMGECDEEGELLSDIMMCDDESP